MSLLTALYRSYEYAEKNEMIGIMDKNGDVILPLYHNSKRSNGENIIEVLISKDSDFLHAEILDKDKVIVFPVTEDSIGRSSGVAPHPLVDHLGYLIQDNGKRSRAYMAQMASWLDFRENEFVRIIYEFLQKKDSFVKIISPLIGSEDHLVSIDKDNIKYTDGENQVKKIELKTVYVTFKIENFQGLKDVGVSENYALRKAYIDYVHHLFSQDSRKQKIICNISNREDYLCVKHIPLIGNARLISQITAKEENYCGRFKSPQETVSIGVETSQKIHLMAKYLLSGKDTCRWLGETAYLVAWFSDDIKNNSEFDLTKNIQVSGQLLASLGNNSKAPAKAISDETSMDIVKSFTKGRVLFKESSSYYVAIFDKTSKGRVAVKYFREIDVSLLKHNLEQWHNNYFWYGYSKATQDKRYIPSPIRIIKAAYGIRTDKGLEVDKNEFLKDQYQNIISAIIEGRSMPKNICQALSNNVKNRQKYRKDTSNNKNTWHEVKFCALAILRQEEGIISNMLDRENTDRSYLYGRLLALYEGMEAMVYTDDNERVTNAEKMWASFINAPVTMNLRLRTLIKPYEMKLKFNNDKKYFYDKVTKDIREVTNLLNDHYDYRLPENNKPLKAGFIFGYEAQMQAIFKMKAIFNQKENLESEEKND